MVDILGGINGALQTQNRMQQWIMRLYGRVGYHKILIAIANKHAWPERSTANKPRMFNKADYGNAVCSWDGVTRWQQWGN